MRKGNNYAGQNVPSQNPNFSRRWTEPPRYGGFKKSKATPARAIAERRWKRQFTRVHQLGGRSGGEA